MPPSEVERPWWDTPDRLQPPWWADLPPERRWYHEYLHVNAEHELGRPLVDVSDKVSGGGIVGSKCYDADGYVGWVDLTDPHDCGPPWPDMTTHFHVDQRYGPPAPRLRPVVDTFPIFDSAGGVVVQEWHRSM